MARDVAKLADRLGLAVSVAVVTGDDVLHAAVSLRMPSRAEAMQARAGTADGQCLPRGVGC